MYFSVITNQLYGIYSQYTVIGKFIKAYKNRMIKDNSFRIA